MLKRKDCIPRMSSRFALTYDRGIEAARAETTMMRYENILCARKIREENVSRARNNPRWIDVAIKKMTSVNGALVQPGK